MDNPVTALQTEAALAYEARGKAIKSLRRAGDKRETERRAKRKRQKVARRAARR